MLKKHGKLVHLTKHYLKWNYCYICQKQAAFIYSQQKNTVQASLRDSTKVSGCFYKAQKKNIKESDKKGWTFLTKKGHEGFLFFAHVDLQGQDRSI